MYLIAKEKDGKLTLRVDCPGHPVVGEREVRAIRNALIQLHLGFCVLDDITTREQRYDFLTPIAHLFAAYNWEEHGGSSPGWLTYGPFRTRLFEDGGSKLQAAMDVVIPVLEIMEPEHAVEVAEFTGEQFLGIVLHLDPLDPNLLLETE